MPLTYSMAQLTDAEARKRAEEMLQMVGLGDRMHHHPSQLSGGQQQRVAVARALINRPSLLLADEPTGNLDSKTSEEILQMFETLNGKEGITIIIVTHDQNVAGHTKRQIYMRDGKIESAVLATAVM
jgi:ABC-type lipoprotein export system ATPase subunit